MKEIKLCPHCGAKLMAYEVRLTPMLVRALIKFRQAINDKGENSVHLLKDMKGKEYELTRHEWNNFSRQRFLGLAVKCEDKSGSWLLTNRGSQFLNGQIEIPESVTIFRNKIVDRSLELINIKNIIGNVPYMESKDDINYQPVEVKQTNLF